MKFQKAFTLLELMIVLAIIGIITAIGWPAYIEQGLAGNRTDGIAATNAVSIALIQYESDNGDFVWDAAPGAVTVDNAHNRYLPNVAVGTGNSNPANNDTCIQNRGFRYSTDDTRYESCRGYYSISVDTGHTSGFKITTLAIGNQVNDDDCRSFTLDNNGVKGYTATTGNTNSSVKRCWGSN